MPDNIRVHVRGDLSQFSKHGMGEFKDKFLDLERGTRNNKGFDLYLYVNYTTANDLQRAWKKVEVRKQGPVKVEDVFRAMDQPEKLDIIIRTGTKGRRRLSGFVPLRDSNTHMIFLPEHFPNLSREKIVAAIRAQKKRVINEGR